MRFLRKEIDENLLKLFERKEISSIHFLKGVSLHLQEDLKSKIGFFDLRSK